MTATTFNTNGKKVTVSIPENTNEITLQLTSEQLEVLKNALIHYEATQRENVEKALEYFQVYKQMNTRESIKTSEIYMQRADRINTRVETANEILSMLS